MNFYLGELSQNLAFSDLEQSYKRYIIELELSQNLTFSDLGQGTSAILSNYRYE
jgi:hypothetical protein